MRNPVAVATGIMLLIALMLQGCGHKGPLFLPPPPAKLPATGK
jgi:predicted small lipoprotein YifL